MKTNYILTIGWLYPELMSTYGDRGNIVVLQKRCEWRDIAINVIAIDERTSETELAKINLLFGGGAQDREQEIVMKDLQKKRKMIRQLVEHNIPSLFVCGSPQLMGNFYEPSAGKRIEGLGIFDVDSFHPGPMDDRLIGNTVAEVLWENINRHSGKATNPDRSRGQAPIGSAEDSTASLQNDRTIIVGFENHGGRSYLKGNTKPFAKVIKGNGNNGKDGYEGMIYKNAIGCYFHGPLLPKNPAIADWLIATALEVKYKDKIELKPLDDSLEHQAKEAILKKLGINR